MDARRGDAIKRANRARQLAFERAQAIDVLLELRLAERVRLVEDLVADRAARGQAVSREHHARVEHFRARHIDRAAVFADLVGNVRCFKPLGDLRHLAGLDAGEEQRLRTRRPCGTQA